MLRLLPRVERQELCNVGVIVFARPREFLDCALLPADELARRALALGPALDLAAVQRHLEAVRAVCRGEPTAGPIAALPRPERFHWLTAPRSTILQPSPVHSGQCADPAYTLQRLCGQLLAQ
ncbi:MAG: DUF3037 domain-containing protein [Myxococcales bacterium]|nr:DUF3037 domain-containing protein [Myxococcales bacterium]